MQSEAQVLKSKITRQRLLLGGMAVVAGGGFLASKWFNIFADVSAKGAVSVEKTYEQAIADDIYLLDIRRPDEWERTGVAAPAIPLDMRRDDFEAILQAIFDKSGERAVALICARDVRSDRMNARLEDAGFSDILDVPEGMLGSGTGPGYIDQGLPTRAPTALEIDGHVI